VAASDARFHDPYTASPGLGPCTEASQFAARTGSSSASCSTWTRVACTLSCSGMAPKRKPLRRVRSVASPQHLIGVSASEFSIWIYQSRSFVRDSSRERGAWPQRRGKGDSADEESSHVRVVFRLGRAKPAGSGASSRADRLLSWSKRRARQSKVGVQHELAASGHDDRWLRQGDTGWKVYGGYQFTPLGAEVSISTSSKGGLWQLAGPPGHRGGEAKHGSSSARERCRSSRGPVDLSGVQHFRARALPFGHRCPCGQLSASGRSTD
jgi:hypothetical protein